MTAARQASLPRFNKENLPISRAEVMALIDDLEDQISEGGGTGDVLSSGENFCFSGVSPNQILKIKNIDTGLANRIDMEGINDEQSLLFEDGSAC